MHIIHRHLNAIQEIFFCAAVVAPRTVRWDTPFIPPKEMYLAPRIPGAIRFLPEERVHLPWGRSTRKGQHAFPPGRHRSLDSLSKKTNSLFRKGFRSFNNYNFSRQFSCFQITVLFQQQGAVSVIFDPSPRRTSFYSPLNFLMILGIKNENTKSPMEKNTLKDISSPQFPDAHTSFRAPMKNVKMKVPTIIPRPVPKR